MPLHPLGVGPGVVILGEGDGDPVPPGLEGLHAEDLPRQLVLQHGDKVRTVGGVVHHLDLLLGGQEVPDNVRGVNGGVVPVEDEPGLHFQQPLLFHPLQKHFEGADDVYSIDSGPPGHHLGADEAFVVKGKDHLLDPAVLGLVLDGPMGPLLDCLTLL